MTAAAGTVRHLSTLTFDDALLDRVRAVSPRVAVDQVTAATAADVPAGNLERILTGRALLDTVDRGRG